MSVISTTYLLTAMTKHDIILVDENNAETGTGEKMDVHKKGLLHRAFSVLVFNIHKELLLQQRALSKYHSPGLWTNTCCSHPFPGEESLDAAHRRLVEEMGFDCELEWEFNFIYKAEFNNGLTEYEFDQVYIGKYDGIPVINPEEVENYKWVSLPWLKREISENPDQFTVWFKHVIEIYFKKAEI